MANTASFVRLYWKQYPVKIPRKGTDAKNIAKNLGMLNVRFPRLVPDPDSNRIGACALKPWKEFVEALYAAGKLKTKKIPVETLYSNTPFAEINKFDKAKVIMPAKVLK